MLTLNEGEPHAIQNLGDAPMYVQSVTGSSAPTDLDAARFELAPGQFITLTAHAGESTWAWASRGGVVGHSQVAGGGAVVPGPVTPPPSATGTRVAQIEGSITQYFGGTWRVPTSGVRREFTAGGIRWRAFTDYPSVSPSVGGRMGVTFEKRTSAVIADDDLAGYWAIIYHWSRATRVTTELGRAVRADWHNVAGTNTQIQAPGNTVTQTLADQIRAARWRNNDRFIWELWDGAIPSG